MKKINYILVLFVSLLILSCSKDEVVDSNANITESFNYKYNGETLTIVSWDAKKIGERILVGGVTTENQRITFEFNTFGNLSSIQSYSVQDDDFPITSSFNYNSSHFVDFNLIEFDENNKVVKVSFNGLLHKNEYNINSDTVSIEGDFSLKYTDLQEQSILIESCKINGQDWHATNSEIQGGFSDYPTELSSLSDDDNIIGKFFYPANIEVGEYTFNNNSSVRMTFSKIDFNNGNDSFIVDYLTSGVLNITEINVGYSITEIKGSYNFAATNPDTNEEILITNGMFTNYYSN